MSRFVRESDEVNPNLIPIMNLFTALIPFLLASAAFFQISVIQISVPVASSSGETDVAKEEDQITLNMRIKRDAFELSGSSDTIEPAVLAKLTATVPRSNQDEAAIKATLTQLGAAAAQIKGKYAASDTVIVVPDGAVPYEDVVAALDAVRNHVIERDGNKHRISLFPRAVLSSLVK